MNRLGIGAIALLLVCCCLAASCGSKFVPKAGWPSASYASREFAFSIDYPASFQKVELSGVKKAGAPLLNVIFADTRGAVISGKAVDTLDVAVYEMSGVPTEADLRKHKADFEKMAAELVGRPPGLRIVEPFAWSTFAGRRSFEGVYTYKIDGEDVAATMVLLFRGSRAYVIRAQASRTTWPTTGRLLESSASTFKFL